MKATITEGKLIRHKKTGKVARVDALTPRGCWLSFRHRVRGEWCFITRSKRFAPGEVRSEWECLS